MIKGVWVGCGRTCGWVATCSEFWDKGSISARQEAL
jgi:hypothetical protein